MPDITMCQAKYCKVRESCYRFMAKPNPYRQSYSDFSVTDLFVTAKPNPINKKKEYEYFLKYLKKKV